MTTFGNKAERRVALVIGNSAYQNIDRLSDPDNDARAMREALQELDFTVQYGVDLNKEAMRESIGAFAALLERERVDVGLVYYSGHGLQVDGVNYCVPVDADTTTQNPLDQLIPLEELMRCMGAGVGTRLMLLDACRNNPFAKQIAASIARSKGIEIEQGKQEPPKGLAEIKAPQDTFIAFAAGPGEVAYEGSIGSGYSAFTDGLLRHIHATDLSLDNLMVRVGKEVQLNTGGKQVSWSLSSLRSTFFFKPGSLVLLIGNAIGLLAFLISLVPYSFALASREETALVATVTIIAATLITASTLILFLLGLQRAYALRRSGRGDDDDANDPGQRGFRVPWRRGLYGGFFGGLIAGPIITIAYNYAGIWQDEPLPHPTIGRLLTDITIGSTIVGLFLGILALTCAQFFVAIRERGVLPSWLAPLSNMLTGSIVGGIIAGVVTGPPETVYYHYAGNRPHLYIAIMLLGAVPGAAIVVFSIVNYSLDRVSLRGLLKSGQTVVLATVVVCVLSAPILYLFNNLINMLIRDNLVKDGIAEVLFAGLMYGIVVGAVLGAVIGLTLHWTPNTQSRPGNST